MSACLSGVQEVLMHILVLLSECEYLDNDKGVSDNLLCDLKGNGKCEEINEIHEGQ